MHPQGCNNRYQSFAPPPLMLPPPPPFSGDCPTYPLPAALPPPPCTPPLSSPLRPSDNVVYISRSPVGRQEPILERPWSTSIFACFKDLKSCFVTALCPCITSGQIAEIVNEGKTSCLEGTILFLLLSMFLNCCCCYTLYTRSKMRRLYKLKGSRCTDCMAHCCCLPCALCQEYRELYHQGFDPGLDCLGRNKNAERARESERTNIGSTLRDRIISRREAAEEEHNLCPSAAKLNGKSCFKYTPLED